MSQSSDSGPNRSLTTSGIFVVQLRSDSDLANQQLHGRIEHVMSGDSKPFVSLAEMLAFMARHRLGSDDQGQ